MPVDFFKLINKLTLSFKDAKLEKEFTEYSINRVKETLKYSVFIAAFSSTIVGLVAYFGGFKIDFSFDVIIQICAGLIFWFISNQKFFQKYYKIYVYVALVSINVVMLYGHVNDTSLFTLLNVYAIFLFITMVPYISFYNILFSILFILASVLSMPVFFKSISIYEAIQKALLLLSYFMIVSLVLYIKQMYERLSFYKSKELEKANKRLIDENKTLEMQSVLAKILKESTHPNININEFLNFSLNLILNISWLKILPKGSIFLTNKNGELEMIAHKNLGGLTKTCAIVKSGQCLCGLALQKKQMLFNNCVTDDHTTRPEGMTPHGHFNIPILLDEEVLGVINIYVTHGHKKTKDEESFFGFVADTLASVVYRNQLEKEKEEQTHIIKNNHLKIKSSINYAQRIQKSLLTSSHSLYKIFDEVLIKYMPKETVSGDFYLVRQKNDEIYITVSDCTGHGVPGALVSVIGIQEIDHIIDGCNCSTNEMINILNRKIDILLNNDDEIGSDGMDLVMLKINKQQKQINFSGAKGLFYLYTNGELVRYKTDAFSIGQKSDIEISFTEQTIPYKTGDTVFLLTDGLQDQISKVNQKRIGTKRLKELLIKVATAPLNSKQNIIDSFIKTHLGDFQIDDITLITFKL